MVHWSKKEEAKIRNILFFLENNICNVHIHVYVLPWQLCPFRVYLIVTFEFQNKTLSFLNKIRYTRGYQNERRLMQKNIIFKPCMLTNLIRNIKQQIFQKSSQVLQYLTILSSNTPLSFMTFDNFIVFEMLPSLLWHKFLQDTR